MAYDLARMLDLLPMERDGAARWIGVGRLLLQAAPRAPVGSVEAVAAWAGIAGLLDSFAGAAARPVREAVATALMIAELRRFFGDLGRLVRLSAVGTRPLGRVPALHDDAGWAAMSRGDVKWLAELPEGARLAGLDADAIMSPAITDRALREYNRRRIWARQA